MSAPASGAMLAGARSRGSAACVGLCSLALMANAPTEWVLPVSYLCFGLLWSVNELSKIPLTAHDSQIDYGGEGKLFKPLFLKTNRILTLCRGILYLAMTVWTVVMFRSGITWIGTLNSLLPMGLSVITIWFQKWYPACVARGR